MKLKIIETGSNGNSYLLKGRNEELLIECGVNINTIKKALDFDYSKLQGCLVTHRHSDHAKSLFEVMSLGIECYAAKDVFDNIKSHARSNIVEEKKVFKIGNFRIMAFSVKHDVPCFGYLIDHPESGKILFLTDTYYCSYKFPGLNNIIIEANYSKAIIDRNFANGSINEVVKNRIQKSHFSLENCLDMLSKNDLTAVNNIVLIHLSNGNSNEREFVKSVTDQTLKTVSAGVNGLEINFNKTPFDND